MTYEIDSACAIKSGVDRYTYRAEWLPDYGEYVGVCVELPYLRREAPTAPEAVAAIEQAAHEHVDALRACGESAPIPLSERSYSGTFVVKTSPALHARLALEASEERVSMNQWIVQKLSGRAEQRLRAFRVRLAGSEATHSASPWCAENWDFLIRSVPIVSNPSLKASTRPEGRWVTMSLLVAASAQSLAASGAMAATRGPATRSALDQKAPSGLSRSIRLRTARRARWPVSAIPRTRTVPPVASCWRCQSLIA
jgi:predicted HicB family RNase H-like nuclease